MADRRFVVTVDFSKPLDKFHIVFRWRLKRILIFECISGAMVQKEANNFRKMGILYTQMLRHIRERKLMFKRIKWLSKTLLIRWQFIHLIATRWKICWKEFWTWWFVLAGRQFTSKNVMLFCNVIFKYCAVFPYRKIQSLRKAINKRLRKLISKHGAYVSY